MARSWFVRPDTATLTLADGQTLTVKRRLNNGETRAMYARLYVPTADGRMKVDPLAVGMATVEAYLLDWTLRDDDNRPVIIRGRPADEVRAALDDLEPERFGQIRDAIDAHINHMAEERDAEKNAPDGESKSSVISPSPSDAAGDLTGSVN